jgi:putative membrane protein
MKTSIFALTLLTAGSIAFAADNAGVAKADKQFFEKAAAGGMFEVEAGKLAESKGQSAEVKSYGSMLVKDHSAANEELKALAGKKGVTLPTALPKDMQKKLDKLSNEKKFDHEFIEDVGMHDHKKDISLFEKTSKNSKDPEVKAFAAKTLPTLQQHHQQADALKKSMKGAKKA